MLDYSIDIILTFNKIFAKIRYWMDFLLKQAQVPIYCIFIVLQILKHPKNEYRYLAIIGYKFRYLFYHFKMVLFLFCLHQSAARDTAIMLSLEIYGNLFITQAIRPTPRYNTQSGPTTFKSLFNVGLSQVPYLQVLSICRLNKFQ